MAKSVSYPGTLSRKSGNNFWPFLSQLTFGIQMKSLPTSDPVSLFVMETLLQTAGVKGKKSGLEIQNSLEVGEQYHAHLQQVYNMVMEGNNEFLLAHYLCLAVKYVNDTAGPPGIVPTLLLFDFFPRIPLLPKNIPENFDGIKAIHDSRK